MGARYFIHLAQILDIKHTGIVSPSITNVLSTICFYGKPVPSSSIFGVRAFYGDRKEREYHYHLPLSSLRKVKGECSAKERLTLTLTSRTTWWDYGKMERPVPIRREPSTPATAIYFYARHQVPQSLFLRETRSLDFSVSVSDLQLLSNYSELRFFFF